jgi:hypothetical protein
MGAQMGGVFGFKTLQLVCRHCGVGALHPDKAGTATAPKQRRFFGDFGPFLALYWRSQ